MTSGKRLSLAACLLTLAAITAHAAEVDADALLEGLVRPAPDTTTFVEVRYSALLTEPLVASGELEHRQDGALVRRVMSPYRETTVLLGENVLVEREGSKSRRFSLGRAPELRGMLGGFGALIKGDREMLNRNFNVTVRGDDASWQIELLPRDDKLKARLSTILVDGTGSRPCCFTVIEPDRDASVIALGVGGRAVLPASLDRGSVQEWCAHEAGR